MNNPTAFRKITDIARKQEDKAARAIKRALDWSTAEVLKSLQRGESGDAIIEEMAPKLESFLYNIKHQNVMEVAIPAYKIARALLALSKREVLMVRGKEAMFSLPGFDDEDFLRQHLNVDIETWLKETSRKETLTTKKELSAAIRKSWDAGEFPGEIDSLTKTFAQIMNDRSEIRAKALAIYATNWAANEAAVLHYKDSDVTHIKWMTAEDEMVCPYCRDLDGTVIPIGSTFAFRDSVINSQDARGRDVQMKVFADTYHPPIHLNCRCAITLTFD